MLNPDLLRSHLDEPGRVEGAVERQRLTDPAPPHHGKAGRINEGILTLCPGSQPTPCFSFSGLVNVHNLDVLERPQSVDETNCGSVP